jgi:hypothetical protein
MELDAPFRIGPITVTSLALALPGVRFPLDLSGGVARFRHRRGELTRIVVEAGAAELIAYAAPRLRGILDAATPDLVVAPVALGALIGLHSGEASLAFDVVVAPVEGDLRLVPERARGVGLGAPAQALALRALAALCGAAGKTVQGAVVIPSAAMAVTRHLLPAAGGRAPSAVGVRWAPPIVDVGRFKLEASSDARPPALHERVLRALELCELAGEADAAASAGDLEGARRRYLAALERAPRHPELAMRLAAVDAAVGDRAEAALSTLIEAMAATSAGALGGDLLAAIGDRDGAMAALTQAAQDEPYGPLAALEWLRVARMATTRGLDEGDRRAGQGAYMTALSALDEAVVRAPAMALTRWARLEARLDLADLRGAKADAEHLEAAAHGADARHEVWRRAAAGFLARGYLAEASSLFERALRYAPNSSEAVAGLARSLRAAREDRRALDLLARAAALAEREGKAAFAIVIDLARGLAEIAGDRPAAIARVRGIPHGEPEALAARLLEGRWRAEIGDVAGASLALGRLRDAVEIARDLQGDAAAAAATLLMEAAQIEERERGDWLSVQRHLGLALRLRPRDRAIAAAFRRAASEVARAAPKPPARAEEHAGPADERTSIGAPEETYADSRHAGAVTAPRAPARPREAPEEDEVLVERLSDRLRADPSDHATVIALADVLTRLERHLDLLALLSARMEEGDDEVRRELAPRRRAVLDRLARGARAAGRDSEAELYEAMRDEP